MTEATENFKELAREHEAAKAPAEAAPTPERFITIPVSEYIYLNRIDSMMDVLIADPSYNCSDSVGAVTAAVQKLRHAMNTAEAVAVE